MRAPSFMAVQTCSLFFKAEDGIRDATVTGVQTCALPIFIAILPVVLSPAVVGMIWRTFMLAPEFGIVDYLAINAGLGSKNWPGYPLLAMISVIVIHTWQWTPFAFMVLLASLASLPEDIYEAARLDRATAWQRFRRITPPLLRPAIVMVVIKIGRASCRERG